MRWLVCIALLALPLSSYAGDTVYVGRGTKEICERWMVNDTTVGGADVTVPCSPISNAKAATDGDAYCPTFDWTVRFTEFTVMATQDLDCDDDADDECGRIYLLTGDDLVSSDAVTSSSIEFGAGNTNGANTCSEGAVAIDEAGETCTRTIDSSDAGATAGPGGFYQIVFTNGTTVARLDEATGLGLKLCSVWSK